VLQEKIDELELQSNAQLKELEAHKKKSEDNLLKL
jgi:hypothetical protein